MQTERHRETAKHSVPPAFPQDEREVLLPQTYGHPFRQEARSQILEDKKQRIIDNLIEHARIICSTPTCPVSSASFEIAPIDVSQSSLAEIRNKTAFKIIDKRAIDKGEVDKIDLVKVQMRRISGHRDEFVPIITAFEHPDGLGQRIKQRVYEEYANKYGDSPPDLVRSRTAKSVDGFFHGLRSHSRGLVIAVSLLGAGTAAAVWGPEVVTEVTQLWREERRRAAEERERARAMLEAKHMAEIKVVIEASQKSDGEVFEGALLKSLTPEHYDTLERRLKNPKDEVRQEALSLFTELAKSNLQAPTALQRGGSSERPLWYDMNYFSSTLTKVIANENNQTIRHQAADSIRELTVFAAAQPEHSR